MFPPVDTNAQQAYVSRREQIANKNNVKQSRGKANEKGDEVVKTAAKSKASAKSGLKRAKPLGDVEGSDGKDKKSGEKEEEEEKQNVQEGNQKRRRLRKLESKEIPRDPEEDPEPPASRKRTPKSTASSSCKVAPAEVPAAKAKTKKTKATQEGKREDKESKQDRESKKKTKGGGKGRGRGKKTPTGEEEEAPKTPERDAVETARADAAQTFEPAIEALRETVIADVVGCLNVCRHSEGDDWGEERKHNHDIPEPYLGNDLQLSVYWSRSAVGLKKKISGKWAQVCYFSRTTPCTCTNIILAKYWVTRLRVENYAFFFSHLTN